MSDASNVQSGSSSSRTGHGGTKTGKKGEGKAVREKRGQTAVEKAPQPPTGPPSGENAFQYTRTDELIGKGSYKYVYKAYDNETAKSVAWNVIATDGLSEADRRRAIEEIKLLGQVGSHENIMNYAGSWLDKECHSLIFITEYMQEGDLTSMINKLGGNLRISVCKRWCRQILSALHFLHTTANVIHRDLKCDNIFVGDGKIKIGDFGLSRKSSDVRDKAKTCLGTPEFMAPEFFDDNPSYGPAVDMYAFGGILIEMVVQEVPYCECAGIGQIYNKIKSGILPASLEQIEHTPLRALVESCLQRDPGERPTAKELLNHAFFAQNSEDGASTVALWLQPENDDEDEDERDDEEVEEQARAAATKILDSANSQAQPVLVDMEITPPKIR